MHVSGVAGFACTLPDPLGVLCLVTGGDGGGVSVGMFGSSSNVTVSLANTRLLNNVALGG
jgi:hypothetical protein